MRFKDLVFKVEMYINKDTNRAVYHIVHEETGLKILVNTDIILNKRIDKHFEIYAKVLSNQVIKYRNKIKEKIEIGVQQAEEGKLVDLGSFKDK